MIGSRVEKVYQPDSATVQIRLFPPRDSYLTLSAAATRPYVVLLGEKLPQPPAPLRFCQLLRSRIEGGGVESVEQVGSDRVVRVVFRKRDDEGKDHRYELIAELFAPHADLYLFDLDESRLLGRLRNGPLPEDLENGYLPPDSAERPSAFGLDAAALVPHLEKHLSGEVLLYRALDNLPPGLGKLAAGIAKAHGVPRAAEALARHLALIEKHAYAPLVLDGREILLAPLEALPADVRTSPFASVAELAAQVMVKDVRASEDSDRRSGIEKQLRDMRKREEERLRHTRENLERCGEADRMENFGNLLKGQLKLIQPYRDSVEVVDWYDPEGGKVTIPLKRNLAPKANVDRYFTKAKKLRASVGMLESRQAEHEDNLAHLDQLEERLKEAVSRDELEVVERAVRAIGRVSTGKPRTEGAGGPLEFVSTDGYRILVGRSSKENDHLSRKLARPHDMWLHAKGLAGAHVVVRMKNDDEPCPTTTLEEAAQLAAHYSKGRYAAKVEVLVTRAGKVKKPSGMAPGQVLVDGAGSMTVRTDPQAPARLARPL